MGSYMISRMVESFRWRNHGGEDILDVQDAGDVVDLVVIHRYPGKAGFAEDPDRVSTRSYLPSGSR